MPECWNQRMTPSIVIFSCERGKITRYKPTNRSIVHMSQPAAGSVPNAADGVVERDPRAALIVKEVVYADLPDDHQKTIMEITTNAYEKFVLNPTRSTWRKEEGARKELEREVERTCMREIAQFIKTNVDQTLGSGWHVVYGRSWASFVTHERMSMIHFLFDGADVEVWKHGA